MTTVMCSGMGQSPAQCAWPPVWVGVPPDICYRHYSVNNILLHFMIIYHGGTDNQADAERLLMVALL